MDSGATLSSQTYGGYHQAAAVLSTFEEHTLKPANAAPTDSLDDLLFDSVPTKSGSNKSSWVIAPDVRQRVLRELGDRDALRRALRANPVRPDDPVQHMLEAYIDGRAERLENQSRIEVAGTFQVVQWLDGLLDDLPSLVEVQRRQELLTLLQPFEELAGAHFRGREIELEKLRTYVGVQPPGSVRERLSRIAASFTGFNAKPLLVIRGPGGVGKSALVSRFIWEHATLPDTERFPWIYIDFDRPAMQPEEPLTLLLEAVRQLGIQYPAAREYCDRIHAVWREQLTTRNARRSSASTGSSSQVTIGAASGERDWEVYLRDFGSLLRNLKVDTDPLLLVLDTFEEAQYRSAVVLQGLGRFLAAMQGHIPRLRVVLSGRGPMDALRLPSNVVELKEFDASSAEAFLEAHGVKPAEIAHALVDQVGRNPLSLKLALDVWRQEGAGPGGIQDLRTRNLFFARVQDSQIQGQLFTRILEHVQQTEVAKLASPGFVLRRITPDLIRNILAKPCGVNVPDDATANALFEQMRGEVSLVRPDDESATDRGVRQPSEIRHIMLPLLKADQPEAARNVELAAVDYYAHRTGHVARAEELYHRLSLQQPLPEIDALWQGWSENDRTAAKPYLYGALDEHELAATERAWLAVQLDRPLQDAERAQADLGAWERDTARRVTELLERNYAQGALEALRERSERSAGSSLFVLEAQVLEQLGQWDAARATVDRALALVSGAADRRLEIELIVYRARLDARAGHIDAALNRLADADALASGRGGDPPARIEVGLLRLTLGRSSSRQQDLGGDALRADLARQFAELTEVQIAHEPAVMGWLAAELSASYPQIVVRVVRLTGLPAIGQTALRALGSALAVWDSEVSTAANEPPGVLARLAGIPVLESLTQAWTSYALQTSQAEFLSGLLQTLDSPYPIAPLAISTLGDILRERAVDLLPVVPTTSLGTPPPPSASVGEAPLDTPQAHITLDDKQTHELVELLANAFSDRSALSDMVRFRLGRSLDSLALTDDIYGTVVQLVSAATAQDWVAELIGGARESQPENPALLRFASQFGLTPRFGGGRIDAVALTSHGGEDVQQWISQLGRLEAQVCRVVVDQGSEQRFGTGFLVGPDVILTAYSVVEEVVAGRTSPWAVRFDFDVKHVADGWVVSAGTMFSLESDWLIDASEPGDGLSAKPDELNYAFLRIAGAPGTRPIGGERAEPSAVWRGWIELPEDNLNPDPSTSVVVLNHSQAGPLQLSIGDGWIASDPAGTRVSYNVNTAPGSAGSPVFTAGWQLVGLHQGRLDRLAGGTPIGAIVRLLYRRGKRYSVGAPPA